MHELVLLDGLDLVAEGQIGVGEDARGHDVARIELQRLVQRIDRAGVVLLLAQRAAEADPGGQIGRIDQQAGAKDLLRFIEVPGFAQFFCGRPGVRRMGADLTPACWSIRFIWQLRVSLGHTLRGEIEHAGAVDALNKALQLDPGNVVAARILADAYLALGDKVEAIKKYKLVHALLPSDEELRGNRTTRAGHSRSSSRGIVAVR